MNYHQQLQIAGYSEFRRIPLPNDGVIMLTSALAEEGKTFITTQLAIAKALKLGTNKPVLFLDLNTFKQRGSELLLGEGHPSITKGLVDVLKDRATIQECILPTGFRQLFVLPFGNADADFIPLEHLQKLDQIILNDLKNYQVIIDSCPLFLRNRRNFDPVELAQIADYTFLVILSGKTPREIILRCKKDIEGVGRELNGVIMNDQFVKPFRSELAVYASRLEKISLFKKPVGYMRARLGIY
ncbi:MAG: hypothetical protein HQM12_01010 [SAR324 cluster bacterium]|nr:hypothetical protein [SAR324 cluster bacterium]